MQCEKCNEMEIADGSAEGDASSPTQKSREELNSGNSRIRMNP